MKEKHVCTEIRKSNLFTFLEEETIKFFSVVLVLDFTVFYTVVLKTFYPINLPLKRH